MRQVGAIPKESDAQRFAAHLVSAGVEAHAEYERETWAIWVRDENHLEEAKAELARFLADPEHSRYQDAERSAAERRRAQERERAKARSNVVEMRGRWGRGPGARRAPLTIALILLSVFVGLTSGLGKELEPVLNQLLFCRLAPAGEGRVLVPEDGLAQIKGGQLWRLVTPIFVHFGIPHLVFNMFVLYYYGAQIEDRRGTWRFALLVLLLAIPSNLAQYLVEGNPYFGGMSGVGYGVFGFVWMRMIFDPKSGVYVSPLQTFIMVAWFIMCVAREFGPLQESLAPVVERVANTAHGVGLVVGLALGCLPVALRKKPE